MSFESQKLLKANHKCIPSKYQKTQISEVTQPKNQFIYKGDKFLKKLKCCIRGGVWDNNLVLTTELMMYDHCSDKELRLKNSPQTLFSVANLHCQISWKNQVMPIYIYLNFSNARASVDWCWWGNTPFACPAHGLPVVFWFSSGIQEMEGSLKVKGQNTSSISSNEGPEMRTFPIGHLKIEGELCGLSLNLNYQVHSTPLFSKLGVLHTLQINPFEITKFMLYYFSIFL